MSSKRVKDLSIICCILHSSKKCSNDRELDCSLQQIYKNCTNYCKFGIGKRHKQKSLCGSTSVQAKGKRILKLLSGKKIFSELISKGILFSNC